MATPSAHWAEQLDDAERRATQVSQISLRHPEMTINDSYEIQRSWVAAKCRRGARVIGHKVGLTSKAMQRQSRIDEPDLGVLLDDMVIANASVTLPGRFIVPRVEPELAFHLKVPLRGPECSLIDVLRATEYIAPALEIIDARIERIDADTGRTRTVLDTIADNAANGGIVLGGIPLPPSQVDF